MREVTAAVVIEEGRLLLVRRAPGEKLAGYWELPGGKVEPGESLAGCLRRELREELAMDSAVGEVVAQTVFQYEHGAFRMFALETRRLSEFALSVHDDYVWAQANEMAGIELAPADVELVSQLLTSGLLSLAP